MVTSATRRRYSQRRRNSNRSERLMYASLVDSRDEPLSDEPERNSYRLRLRSVLPTNTALRPIVQPHAELRFRSVRWRYPPSIPVNGYLASMGPSSAFRPRGQKPPTGKERSRPASSAARSVPVWPPLTIFSNMSVSPCPTNSVVTDLITTAGSHQSKGRSRSGFQLSRTDTGFPGYISHDRGTRCARLASRSRRR